ncbi:ras-related protein rab-5c [Anaeramoeba ignava]|uniref:Ras-related protein rab-5c n=1 Tax=Anaeramoeba ignava TaxID=1746090 RepID=A0A9Q0LMY5_ANAIG|nr:ras-related protein rab-5c [Anaeramoeba ignava]
MSEILVYKMVLVGHTGVGKSCLTFRFCQNEFDSTTKPTLGSSYLSKVVEVNGMKIQLNIWDTAGQERYLSIAPMFYHNSSAAIVTYDITNYESFQKSKLWVDELLVHRPSNIEIAFVGNKLDLSEKRRVTKEEAEEYAKQNGFLFYETSAKTGENVEKVFLDLVSSSSTTHLSKRTS